MSRVLLALLLVSALLRLALVFQGGQYFFGDEQRYDRGIQLYQAIRHGDGAGIRLALSRPEHVGFVLIGAAVTAGQHLLAQATPYADWSRPENVVFTIKAAAACLSLFSVLNLALLFAVVRAHGGTERAAECAALCLALANAAFYFSRHLLPYDAAITVALVSWWLSARWSGDWRAAAGSGMLAAAAYHVYNGYWFLVPVLGAVQVANSPGIGRWLRVTAFGLGAAVAGGLPILMGLLLAGGDYWRTMVAFSNTVNFGRYAEGWTLPWEYLAHTEGLFGVLVAIAMIAALATAWRAREALPRSLTVFLLALVMSYGLLVLFSNGLHKFVVYARTVKPLLVMLCAIGGWAVARLLAGRQAWRWPGMAVLGVAGGLNLLPNFSLTFPAEVEVAVMREFGNPKRALSFAGSLYFPLLVPVTRPDLVLVDAQMLYPLRHALPLPAGRTIFRLAHPLTYQPFQYEGHSPRERALLRTHPPALQLIQLPPGSTVPDHPPPALRFTAEDRPDGRK